MEEIQVKPQKKTFKERYDNDPEMREKHQAYCKETIECPGCKRVVTRSNYATHLKSKIHERHSLARADPALSRILTEIRTKIEEIKLNVN